MDDAAATELLGGYSSEVSIPAIDNDPAPAAPEPQYDDQIISDSESQTQDDASAVAAEPQSDTPAWATGDSVKDELIAQFAKEMKNLDPNDPEDLKTLIRVADKELHIKNLESRGQQPSVDAGLTAFERSLQPQQPQQQQHPQQPQQQLQPQQPQPQAPPPARDDAGKNWNSATDAFDDYADAWTGFINAEGPAAKREASAKLEAVQEAIADRQIGARLINFGRLMNDHVNQLLDQRLNQQLGDVIPQVRQQLDQQRIADSRDFALRELAATPEYKDINSLDKPDQDNPLRVNGEEFPNTPMNRIIAENPYILQIQVNRGPDGRPLTREASERLTMIERMRAVAQLHKAQQIDSGKARSLINAGKNMTRREQQDSARRGINRGSGTNQLTSGKAGHSYVQDLLSETAGGEISMNDL